MKLKEKLAKEFEKENADCFGHVDAVDAYVAGFNAAKELIASEMYPILRSMISRTETVSIVTAAGEEEISGDEDAE